MNRRIFLLSGAAFAAGAAPSDRIGVGVIGSGGRGTFVMGVFQKDPAVRVSAICDVYEPNLEKALSAASKAQAAAAKAYRNYAALLADAAVDAVLIATPEHWHHDGSGCACGGQGRVCREAAVSYAGRRRRTGRRGGAVAADRASGDAAAQLRPVPGGTKVIAAGRSARCAWRDPGG